MHISFLSSAPKSGVVNCKIGYWCAGIKEIVLDVESVPNLRASGNQRQLDPR